jgi:serine/threonine protein kinase/Tol biopolymer transport system component
MPLSPGTRLGPYEIRAAIGAGGMGEVYKATDTRLHRTVAIKVLPPELAADPQFRERFDREARTISQLDHPHLCALYDVGEHPSTVAGQGAISYLVMQFLEGETLAARLERGPLPLHDALRVAVEIADALDRAHRAGIVHRDLKPGNIFLTKAGAKLLDFGLAKTGGPPVAGSGFSMLPTTPRNLTAQGTILGTFQYMAPEQLEGEEADARTDIFAFGCVLYEMLTGRKAFEGKTQASLIGAILEREPAPLSTLQPLTPQALERVVHTCLAKRREDRLQTVHDLWLQLRWIAEGGSAVAPAPAIAARGPRSRFTVYAAGAFALASVLLAAVLVTTWSGRSDPSLSGIVKLSIVPPERTMVWYVAMSPDGARLLMSGFNPAGVSSLYLRSLDAVAAQPIKGTERATGAFWSADGRSIAFASEGKLRRLELPDGSPQTICDTANVLGGTWNRDGVILFVPSFGQPIVRVPATGGNPVAVTKVDEGRRESAHLSPEFLPDGQHYLYFVRSADRDVQGIYVGSLEFGTGERLLGADSAAQYARPGYLLFVREGTLLAQAFDASSRHLSGEPTTVAANIEFVEDSNQAAFTVSDAGRLAYREFSPFRSEAVWMDEAGREVSAVPADAGEAIALAPDERRIAITRPDPRTAASDVWIVDLGRATASKLTTGTRNEENPIWAHDGSRLAFNSDEGSAGYYDLYEKPTAGGVDTLLLASEEDKQALDWSRDGRFLLYGSFSKTTRADLWVLPLSGDRKPAPFVQSPANEGSARFSPDSRWIAYTSDESGRPEVYVQPFPATGAKVQVSVAGGQEPRWSADGRRLFYRSADSKLMSVAVTSTAQFDASNPRALFDLEEVTDYAVSRDARFLLNRVVSNPRSLPITVVLNWTAALRN